MNERTHFFKKIYLSLFILARVDVSCVRGELETGTDSYILSPSSSDHSSTSFAFWLGCSTEGHWGPKALRLPLALNSASCPQLTPTATGTRTDSNWPKPSVAPGYIIVSRTAASCRRTHLPPSPNSATSTGQGDIPISSTGCTCFAVLSLIYTGESFDWRLGRGSICYNERSY